MEKQEVLDIIFQWTRDNQPWNVEIGWYTYDRMKCALHGKIPEFKREWDYRDYMREDPRFEVSLESFRVKRNEPWPRELNEGCLFRCMVELCRSQIDKQQDRMTLSDLAQATGYAPMTVNQSFHARVTHLVEKVDKNTLRLVLDPSAPLCVTPAGRTPKKKSRLTSLIQEVIGGELPDLPAGVPSADLSKLYGLLQICNAGIASRESELSDLYKGIETRKAELAKLQGEKVSLMALLPTNETSKS